MSDYPNSAGTSARIIQNRPRLHAMVLIAGLLLAIAASAVFYEKVSHSRCQVVGKTDPITRYYVEYTVSSRYHKSNAPKMGDASVYLPGYVFSRNPPPIAIQWVYTHILRKKAPGYWSVSPGWVPGTISQCGYQGFLADEMRTDKQGYVDLSGLRKHTIDCHEEQFLISACPATWCTYTLPGTGGEKLRFFILYIKPKDKHLVFAFYARDDSSEPTDVGEEMVKVRESVRVVRKEN